MNERDVVVLDEARARALTERIRGAAEELYALLLEAYEGEAWRPLGYESWSAYIASEFTFARQHAYRLLDQGRVIRALNEAVSPVGDTRDEIHITERLARDIAPVLPEFIEEVRAQTAQGMGPKEAVAGAVGKFRPLMSSESVAWYSPPEILERAVQVLGRIDLDPCSEIAARPTVPARARFTEAEDGLAQEWRGTVYMNPPYGTVIREWCHKLVEEYDAGRVTQAIALVPARPDTQWWTEINEFALCFIEGRLKFSGHQNSAPFPSAVFYLGDDVPRFIREFRDLGGIYQRIDAT